MVGYKRFFISHISTLQRETSVTTAGANKTKKFNSNIEKLLLNLLFTGAKTWFFLLEKISPLPYIIRQKHNEKKLIILQITSYS